MLKSFFTIPFLLFSGFAFTQTADFTYQSGNGLFCNPSTIQFTQNCTGNPIGFVWDFGNNTKGYDAGVSVTYATAGTFTVKLIAIYDQTAVEVSKTIVINPKVTASLGFDKNYICNPGSINFTANTSGNIVNYAWDFGDSSGTINTAANVAAHNYGNFGNYTVTLKATDTTGCEGSATTTIKVNKPTIVATVSPASGCIPANVNFNSTIGIPATDAISSYNWDFGDGSPVSSTATKNTTHLYGVVGTYSPRLSFTTKDGCTGTYNFPALGFGSPPFNDTAYPQKVVVCGSETPVFVAKATNANNYVWNFGDGGSATVTDTLTQHKYATLGIKTVTVTPFFNGCPGKTTSFPITVVGVIAKYTYSNTCINRKAYSFINASLGNATSFKWQFGDNSANIITANAIHTFPVTGQFITSLAVTDAVTGCSDSIQQTIYTAEPTLVNPDSSVCKNSNTSFSIKDSYTNSAATYTWNIVGNKIGPTTDSAITVKAGTLGNFNNFVAINYGTQSCPDTLLLDNPVLVKGPNLAFTAPASICFNTPFSITNNSKPFIAKDSITRWYWNYGISSLNDTIYQPVPFVHKQAGTYAVKLTAIDINGCKDSLIKITKVNPNPFLRVVPRIDTLCAGMRDTLRAFSSTTVLWSPSNNISCTTCDTVVANPGGTTQYFVTATNAANCTTKDSVLVKVYAPFKAVVPSNSIYICRNDQVQLDVAPKTNRVTWSPAAGLSNPAIYNPVATPLQNTSYTATLTDSVGCFSSSATINIGVKSLPTVDAGPDRIVPYSASFSIAPAYSSNISKYNWAPPTLLNCTSCPITTGTALFSDTYTIAVTSDSGCVATDKINISIECKNSNILLPKAFTPNNDNLNDYYYPVTRGIKSILKFIIYNRQGQVMYEAKNFPPNSKSFAWNGEFKGQLQPAAAYVYILEALCDAGQTIIQKGSLLLLR